MTQAAFCHGHCGLIIVSGLPESSACMAWKEHSCMQTAKQTLITSLNSFGCDFYVSKRVSFEDQSVCRQTEIHTGECTCNTVT